MSSVDVRKLPPSLIQVYQRLADAGATTWLVGGSVRDMLLDITPKDFDLEVYGLAADPLQKILKKLGRVEFVGKQFGVFKLWLADIEIDVALPRTERKTSSGHRGFTIDSDPSLTPEIATLRRDFTINALMLNPKTGEILDLHDGKKDLKNGILRHVSEAFSEDPLRPLRAMQFAARFKLSLAKETALLCRELITEGGTLPKARVWSEWKKWCHAAYPSYGLQVLIDSGWNALYPELHALVDCPQSPHWHPEGNVWLHTLQCCDQAAAIAERNQLNALLRQQLMFATLCHDLGKPLTTSRNEDGNIISPGHSEAGIKPTKSFMTTIGAPVSLIAFLFPLIKEHITHLHGKPTDRAIRRLAHRLEPANIELWEMLVEADTSGRFPAPPGRPALIWLEQAEALHSHLEKPEPLLTGKMLLEMDVSPGPEMGRILDTAYHAQLDGEISDTASAMRWYRQYEAVENTQAD